MDSVDTARTARLVIGPCNRTYFHLYSTKHGNGGRAKVCEGLVSFSMDEYRCYPTTSGPGIADMKKETSGGGGRCVLF